MCGNQSLTAGSAGAKYDALPRDKEYGVAEFVCPSCGHIFRGRGRVSTTSPCYISAVRSVQSVVSSQAKLA